MYESHDPEEYASTYKPLASALGFPDWTPVPGEVEFVRHLARPECCELGMLRPPDCFFAAAAASILHPEIVLEIGTGSGFSAAIFAKMISLRAQDLSGIVVHTIDLKEHSAGDPTKGVGFAIDAMTPRLRPHIRVHAPADSALAAQLLAPGELPFAFIDANHQHPAPLLDVLRVAALMPPGTWILMHDIDLAAAIAKARATGYDASYEPRFGPQHVFGHWPAKKISAGNIGAVQVPTNFSVFEGLVAKLRKLPAEVSFAGWKQRWRAIDGLIAGSH